MYCHLSASANRNSKVNSKPTENVAKLKYLGKIVTNWNCIPEESNTELQNVF
jgi:hypothetical protein